MTDRELLEAAAKAAGIEIEWERDPAFVQERWQAMVPCGWAGQPTQCEWNPLREDGDALRLAVKLHLEIDHNHPLDNDAWVMALPNGKLAGETEEIADEQERYAATRRAIVRAAAAMSG